MCPAGASAGVMFVLRQVSSSTEASGQRARCLPPPSSPGKSPEVQRGTFRRKPWVYTGASSVRAKPAACETWQAPAVHVGIFRISMCLGGSLKLSASAFSSV